MFVDQRRLQAGVVFDARTLFDPGIFGQLARYGVLINTLELRVEGEVIQLEDRAGPELLARGPVIGTAIFIRQASCKVYHRRLALVRTLRIGSIGCGHRVVVTPEYA